MSKLIQWNCRGYRSRYLDIQNILQQHQPVCLFLQETMLGNHTPNPLPNYNIEVFAPTPQPTPGKGLAILIRKDSGCNRLTLNTNLQAMALQINFFPALLTICNIYIPPGEIIQVNDLIDLVDQLPRPCVIGGDLNAKHTMWGNNVVDQRGRDIEELLRRTDVCLLNTIQHTHFHVQTGTTSAIDLTLSSPDLAPDFQWSVLDDLYGSDHFPIVIESLTSQPNQMLPHLLLRKADWITFTALTSMADYEEDATVEDMNQQFVNTVRTAASIAIPRSEGGTVQHNVPWWNAACNLAKSERKRALRRYQRTRLLIDKIAYNRTRAIAQMTYKTARRESWRKYVSSLNSTTPLNKVWKRVNRMKNKHRPNLPCLKIQGSLIARPEEVANALANNFEDVSSGRHYSPRFLPIKTRKERYKPDFSTREQFDYNDPITMLEPYNALTQAGNSAPGPDEIAYKMLKRLHPSALRNLLALFNGVFATHQCPRDWKEATVLAFPKPGKDSLLPRNYRPIALTSCVCKLMEKIVNIRLVRYLEYHSIINPHQYGFRRCRGTTDSLIRLQNYIKSNLQERKHTICIFFDLEKAYDTTWRHGILETAHRAGIRGHLGFYLQDFLRERRFRVRVGSSFSAEKVQSEGVPQGSVISCTLFLLALNDIVADLPADVYSSLYVDDLMLFASSRHLPVLGRRLQRAINKIENWGTEHGFKFSTLKTVAVHFNPSRIRTQPPDISLANHPIPYSEQAKFLGLTFDHKLSWEPHIRNLKSVCTRKLDLLKCLSKLTWGSDRTTLFILYRSLIRSKLDYGCIIYQSANKTLLSTLNPVHNAAIRLCTGAFRSSPVLSLTAESGEPPLCFRRIQLTLQYLSRLHQLPESPTWSSVIPSIAEDGVPDYFIPSSLSYPDTVRLANLNIHQVSQVNFNNIPTWRIPISTFCRGGVYPKKSETPPSELKNIFTEHLLSEHSNSVHIYTDGSKSDGSVGCAATSIYGSVSKRLHPATSVFSAELYAIVEALDMIERLPYINFTIFSDSQSAVSASRQYSNIHPIICSITSKLALLHETYKTVNICWLPSHVDIRGNEEADEAARLASLLDDPPTNDGVPCRDHYPSIKGAVMDLWQQEWNNVTGNKLKNIKDKVKPWSSSCDQERRLEVALCRLRIGHTRLTHGYLMERTPPPMCDHCHVQITVQHIISDCPKFNAARRETYPTLSQTDNPVQRLRIVLAESERKKFYPEKLKSFLTKCELNDKL